MPVLAPFAVLASLSYAGAVSWAVINKYGPGLDALRVLYVWHPLAACASLVFVTLGFISAQRPHKERSNHKALINQHAMFQIAAMICASATVATIYLNKEKYSKPHLQSNHGKAGATVFLMWLGAQVVGGLAWFQPNLVASGGAALKRVYAAHSLFGYTVFAGMLGVHGLALASGYQGFSPYSNEWYGLAGALGLLGLLLLAGARPGYLLKGVFGGSKAGKAA